MKKTSALRLTQAAMIAAIYVVLTYFISAFGLANGAIQVRISEALTILPIFTPAAYGLEDAVWYLMLTVGIGEVLSICVLGMILKKALWKHRFKIFKTEE